MKKISAKILITFLFLGLISACGNSYSDENSNENDKSKIESVNLPQYIFDIDSYVQIQEKEITSLDLKQYLPKKDMELSYEIKYMDDIKNTVYVEPYNDYRVEYCETNDLVESAYLGGYFYYDEKADCLAKVLHNSAGEIESDIAYIVPIGKMLEEPEGVTIQDVKHLYTVTTEAGIFEDCVCVVKEENTTDKNIITANYYAIGIGEVLSVSNFFNDKDEFEVIQELSGIIVYEDYYSNDEQSLENENIDDYSYQTYIPQNDYFFDGQSFECFETQSGEDIKLTIKLFYDSYSQIFSYKGELSNGVEFWFDWYSYDISTNETQFKIRCIDNSTAYLIYNSNKSEILIIAEKGEEYGNMYAYSGNYIGLPDTTE